MLSNASKELFLGYVNKLISECPQDYQCPQWNYLTIDEWGTIITCCCLPKDHQCYSLNLPLTKENISEEKIRKAVRNQTECNICIQSGQAYWGHNPHKPYFVKLYFRKYFIKTMTLMGVSEVKRLLYR